jgi:hypothetical protein
MELLSDFHSSSLSFSRRLGVVGKGLLFDTGGYNIKRGMMELMKFELSYALLGRAPSNALFLTSAVVPCPVVVAALQPSLGPPKLLPNLLLTTWKYTLSLQLARYVYIRVMSEGKTPRLTVVLRVVH